MSTIMNKTDDKQKLIECVLQYGLHVHGRITSNRGFQQNWLVDLRAVLLRPEQLHAICTAFWERNPEIDNVHIAGVETAAIPLVTGLVIEAFRRGKNVSGLIIRKSRKKIGLGRLVEGEIRHKSVIIVDDIMNSGNSLEMARVALRQVSLDVAFAFVVVDFQSQAGRRWTERQKIVTTSLMNLSDLGLTRSTETNTKPAVEFHEAWRFTAPGGFPYYTVPKSTPLLVDDRLFFGSDSGTVWCIRTTDGRVEWKRDLPGCGRKGIWSSPAWSGNHLFIGAYNGTFYCLDPTSGKSVWEQSLCEWIGSSPVISLQHGIVFVGLEYARPRAQGSICALSISTGERIWEKLLRVFQHGSGAYAEKHDVVVFGTNDHNVFALDAATGQVRWRFDTQRSVKYAPAIDEKRNIVTFSSFDGSIYILRLSDGQKLAQFRTDSICYTTPLLRDNRMYCGSGDKHMYVVDLDNLTMIKRIDSRARIFSSPRCIGDHIIYGNSGGVVREINGSNYKVRGQLTVPDGVANAVAVAKDASRIFVPTVMNEIYAFDRYLKK